MMNFLRPALVLIVFCAVSAACLSFADKYFSSLIEKSRAQALLTAKMELLPGAALFKISDDGKVESGYDSFGREAGKIFYITAEGYSGPIYLMAGVSSAGEITKLKVVKHSETPGIGSKLADEGFLSLFMNKGHDELYLKKDSSKGSIDAISGATVTSKAVTDALRKAVGKPGQEE